MLWRALLLVTLVITGCDQQSEKKTDVTTLTVWAHSGQEAERKTLQQQVGRFNELNKNIQVKLSFIPERSYNSQVQSAALAGDLPDILEFDGPYLFNYVWQGHLIPVDALLSAQIKKDLIPSIVRQGTYNDRLYGVGTFDSGLGLFARKTALTSAGVRIPNGPQDAWSAQEFDALLKKLSLSDKDGAVLDLKLNYPAEWYTYAFSPMLQSAGADLIDRKNYQQATGTLNNQAAIEALTQLQSWLRRGLVDPNVDDAAFTQSRVALSLVGHWEYRRYMQAVGDDLLLLPLPDFGKGVKTGQGSWVWGVSRYNKHLQATRVLLAFLLQTEEVLAMANANGAVPATQSAIASSELYRQGGPLHLYALQLLEGYAVPRPKTPAYPVITSAFYQALQDIRNGQDVKQALTQAATIIDQDIKDNKGYPEVP